MKVFTVNELSLIFQETEDNLLFWGICPTALIPQNEILPETELTPPFMAGIQGQSYGGDTVATLSYCAIAGESKICSVEESPQSIKLVYRYTKIPMEFTVLFEKCKEASAVRVKTSVKNIGNDSVILTHLTSAFLQGIAADEFLRGFEQTRLAFTYASCAWCGENQWRSLSPSDLGIYYCGTHVHKANFHLEKNGSQTTSQNLPLIFAEDRKLGAVYYLQMEAPSSWHIEAGYRNIAEQEKGSFYLLGDAARERNGHFYSKLEPQEIYEAESSVIGCCTGGLEDAVRQLTLYRREKLKISNAWQGEFPVIYNDYMNALWGNPTLDRLLPLIDAAANVGAEGFCIDSGWYDGLNEFWGIHLGDWIPSVDRFAPKDLQYVLDYIKDKGMIPGVWLEMEVCNFNSNVAKQNNSWFIQRNGIRVSEQGRYFLDFKNPEVRAYMMKVIDRLVSMGVGFIKNDYNSDMSIGDDKYGSPACQMQKHAQGFLSFIDDVRAKYPFMIIENCGSGALRQDNGTLSHFHLQSVSDQEDYRLMPSIVQGGLMNVLPEQLGVWSYPCPLPFSKQQSKNLAEVIQNDNEEETVFNMVSGMAGNLYLSGMLSYANKANLSLIREGVLQYRCMQHFIRTSFPVNPVGLTGIADIKPFVVLMLENADRTEAYLYVWRRAGEIDTVEFSARGYRVAKKIYPSDKRFDCHAHITEDQIKITLQNPYTARLLHLTK